jgi:outer membrane protein assembly factor BamB
VGWPLITGVVVGLAAAVLLDPLPRPVAGAEGAAAPTRAAATPPASPDAVLAPAAATAGSGTAAATADSGTAADPVTRGRDAARRGPPREAGDEPTRTPHRLVDRTSVGQPWGTVDGLTTFRGNPTRSFYGRGPVPDRPTVAWRYPERAMCTEESLPDGETKQWCGTGWTGQPLVWEVDGRTEVVVGAYDHAVHFVDGATGRSTRPRFVTGHMVKGTETLDPDGFPLLYTGSRDGYLRVIALDRDAPTELWALPANPSRVWNNDWDGSPAIVDDVLYVGGEDSFFYAVKLNRSYDRGRVTVDPQVLLALPGFTPELFAAVGDRNVSFESSVALFEGRAYAANSGGRVLGLDVSRLERTGAAPVVFDFWTGDDTDATITIDGEGMLYVAVELQRFLPRARDVGQLLKLDPYAEGDPVVWSVDVPPRRAGDDGGIWATPTLGDGVLYVSTHAGDLLAVDTDTGDVVFRERIGYHEWGSAALVGDTLVVPLCEQAGVRAYDVSDPRQPVERWTVRLGGCVESTPAVWDGRIYVGSRDGYLYAIADVDEDAGA